MPANTGLFPLMRPRPRVSRFMLKSVFLPNQQRQAPTASHFDLARSCWRVQCKHFYLLTNHLLHPNDSAKDAHRESLSALPSEQNTATFIFNTQGSYLLFLDPFEVALLGIANLICKSLFATKTASDTSARFTRWNPPRLRLNLHLQLHLHLHRPRPAVSSISQLRFES